MTTLHLIHTSEAGSLVLGTSPHDGAGDILKAHGWKWSNNLSDHGRGWFMRGSRGHLPQRGRLDKIAEALRGAGFNVVVEIDATPADPAAMEAQRLERAAARAERLEQRAAKAELEAERRFAAGRQIADGIPMGQPILVGHHSEGRHRRDLARIDSNYSRAFEASQKADELRSRAQAAAANTRPVSKFTLGNRIETLEADVRKAEKECARYTDPTAPRVADRLARLDDLRLKLDYERSQWAQRVASGEFTEYGPTNVAVGDVVRVRGRWVRVVRVNQKTCSVETPYSWTDKVPWHHIDDHKSPAVVTA